MFTRLLIANRGEIACRIIRTAKKLGMICIAIYSEADKNAQHVRQADEAYYIGPAPSRESYLNIAKIMELAKQAKIAAIHPGYGFLAENAAFAEACTQAEIIFIGPTAQAIQLMGHKAGAKRIMASAGIPLLPSYHEAAQDPATLQAAAERIGFPVLLKAAAGGGGKGMRVVESAEQFSAQLAAAKRESLASFGSDEIIIEKYLTKPRHIEVQIFADNQGNIVHLFDRDCSIQRRYQKVIEEAPAPNIPAEIRTRLHQTAIKAVEAIRYAGAGTLEFLLDEDQQFYFMEMNTRLQVEHPVTEMITGYDLVEWQLRIAAGEPLPVKQADVKINGHAFEARICAENPQQDFLPSAGRIHFLQFPSTTAEVRVDSGIIAGDSITPYYDSLLAKLIVHGRDRTQALQRLNIALAECRVVGIHTNLTLLQNIVTYPDFDQAQLHTHFINQHQTALLSANNELEPTLWLAAGLYCVLKQQQIRASTAPYSPWHATDGWRLNTSGYQQTIELRSQQQSCSLQARYLPNAYLIKIAEQAYSISGSLSANDELTFTLEGRQTAVKVISVGKQFYLLFAKQIVLFEQVIRDYEASEQTEQSLSAPLPGTIVALLTKPKEQVKKGQPLLVLEAMKMEHVIKAPYDGVVETIYYQLGEQVMEHAELVNLTPSQH